MRVLSLRRARKAARRGEPDGLHDLRVALRRAGATSGALGAKPLARRAKAIVRSLSDERQLEVDRKLLARLGQLGHLSADAATALGARWEELAERATRRIARKAGGRALRTVVKDLRRRSRRKKRDLVERLERARVRAETRLARPLEGMDDEALHRYRIAVKKARYLAEDLEALGVRRLTRTIEGEKQLQETLGRWNDLRLFKRRLAASRDEAEGRGAISLAAELERLLAALETAISDVRSKAVEGAREAAARARGPVRVVPFRRQAARQA
jgi:CHAD domain-containing protein